MDSDYSTINSIGMSFGLAMGILIIVLPRKYATIPMMATGCYITLGQMVYMSSLHFTMMRIIIFMGWLRLVIRRDVSLIKINILDKIIISWVIASFVIYNLREANTEALINRLGFAYNSLGLYFLFRFLVQSIEDIERTIKALALLITPLALFMIIEKVTGKNIFSIFGGVNEYTVIRDGRLRCQGPFRHPILAGTLGATTMPLFFSIFFNKKYRVSAAMGIISATVIMFTAASSGPLTAYGFAIIGLLMWHFRAHIRIIKWLVLITLVSLHIVMKAPIWFLIGRLGHIVGGTAWHRSLLIDSAVNYIDEWWLLGTHHTSHWMPFVMPDDPEMADITNQYIWEGINGGLLSMLLFIAIIILCFNNVGKRVKIDIKNTFQENFFIWSLGVALSTHVVTFLSVVYFDQMIIFWFLLLAFLAIVCDMNKQAVVKVKQ